MKAGARARQGLILGMAGVEAGAMLATGALRHAGWWLDWHMRPGGGAQPPDSPLQQVQHAAVRLMRAA